MKGAGAIDLAAWNDWLWAELFDDADGDGRPVSILHIDDGLFVRAAARGGNTLSPEAARQAFLTAFPSRSIIQRWLTGVTNPGPELLPFLVLCCVAASEAADSDDNDYRRRLRDLMEWDLVITNCETLPALWRRLASRALVRAKTVPTRPLELPNPRFRTQIGHAIELTFPSSNDARKLRSDMTGERFDMESPRAVLEWLGPLVARERYSSSFKQTFEDFQAAWLSAERALVNHRFWCGWRSISQVSRHHELHPPLEIVSDDWGYYHLVDPSDETPLDLEGALRARDLPLTLVAEVSRSHMIPLVEAEWGRLRWTGEQGPRPTAALIRERAFGARATSLKLKPVSGAEGWGLTFEIAEALGRRAQEGTERDRLIDATLASCMTAAARRAELDVECGGGLGGWAPPTVSVASPNLATLRALGAELDIPVTFLRTGLGDLRSFTAAEPSQRTETRPTRTSIRLNGTHAPMALLTCDRPEVGPAWAVLSDTGERYWRRREDAVLDAYRLVDGRPFARRDDILSAADARLPTAVARWMRLTTGIACGPLPGGGYAYPCGIDIEDALRALEPTLFAQSGGLMARAPALRSRRWRERAVASAQGSVIRPIWREARDA